MKNINKKNIDALALLRGDKEFEAYSKEADARIRLAAEVLNKRQSLRLSQQDLAKEIGTTQKVISKIENAEVNPGLDLLTRIVKFLDFSTNNLSEVFQCRFEVVAPFFQVKNENRDVISKTVEDEATEAKKALEIINTG